MDKGALLPKVLKVHLNMLPINILLPLLWRTKLAAPYAKKPHRKTTLQCKLELRCCLQQFRVGFRALGLRIWEFVETGEPFGILKKRMDWQLIVRVFALDFVGRSAQLPCCCLQCFQFVQELLMVSMATRKF